MAPEHGEHTGKALHRRSRDGVLVLCSQLAIAHHSSFLSLPSRLLNPPAPHPILSSQPAPFPLPSGLSNSSPGHKLTSDNSAAEAALDGRADGRATSRVDSSLEEHGRSAIDGVEMLLVCSGACGLAGGLRLFVGRLKANGN
jgi:hypothetical protein